MNILRRLVLVLGISILFSSPFFMVVNARADDAYEENDTWDTAWHPVSTWARTWLSDINGLGIQADEDWYRIDVDPASVRLQVDCRFTHAEGDIDIELYDSSVPPVRVAISESADDDEFIDVTISSGGTYYIRVFFSDVGNTYDLRWDDLTEDAYEENDTLETAWHPGYNWERKYLANINGFGIQADDDWYRIDVDPGSVRVQVDCQFTHAEGDINIALYDSTGAFLTESNSVTDDEFIDYPISSGGTYYIKVSYGNAGNTYDLWWNDLSEDVYEENDNLETAWHGGYNWVRTWLTNINGLGVQADDDWYRIDVNTGSKQLLVDCRFIHADGDIDIGLYDSIGNKLAETNSVTDDEFIDYPISSGGTYYIRVFYSDVGNTYDLWWDDLSLPTTLISDFGTLGLWQDDGSSWSMLTPSNAEHLVAYWGKLVGDFGSAGLWQFDGSSWTILTPADADNTGNCMVVYGTGLVIDFGSYGLYRYDGGVWTWLTPSDAEYLATYGNKLVGDFGSAGLWQFDGSLWTKLDPSDVDNSGNCMVAYGTGLVIDFGNLGLYQYDGGVWNLLTPLNAQHLATYRNKLVGDFGSDGLREFDGSSWTKLTPSDADNSGNCMVAYGTGLVIDFGGLGLWEYDGSSTWSRITLADAQHLAVSGSKLVGDFGSAGLWEFDGSSWTKLTPSDADNTGNCMVAVDFM
jgi:hypothetical protein